MQYLDKFKLTNKSAVITGGGRGIGLCCAQALAEAGAKVIIIEPLPENINEALELNKNGFNFIFKFGNVSDTNRINEIADELNSEGVHVDILINNAGIGNSGIASENVEDSDWNKVMDVNLNGVFKCSRAFGRFMIKQGHGVIVNLGSMSGNIANRPQPQTPYNVSKAAVHHLTKSMAAEWAQHGIRINAVAPTYIETPMVSKNEANKERIPIWLNDTPMGRMGKPEEVASVVLFLASDASSLMTGAIVNVDAGFTCW